MYNNNGENGIDEFGIHELRTLARDIGVKSPTTKKKEELIEAIRAIQTGKIEPDFNNKFGRPVKRHSSQSSLIMQLMVDGDTELEDKILQAKGNENMLVFEQNEDFEKNGFLFNKMQVVAGVLRQTTKGTYYFVNTLLLSELLYVVLEEKIVNKFNLIVGDFISGTAVVDNKEQVAKLRTIKDVNDIDVDSNVVLEDEELVIPTKILEEPNFKMGQSKIVGVSDTNNAIEYIKEKTEQFSKQNITCVVVGLEISIETKLKLDKINNLFQIVSTYDDRASLSKDKLLDAQNYVMSQFKHRKNVVCFVLNLFSIMDVLRVACKNDIEEQNLLIRKTIASCRATNTSSISIYGLYNLNQAEDYNEELKTIQKFLNN